MPVLKVRRDGSEGVGGERSSDDGRAAFVSLFEDRKAALSDPEQEGRRKFVTKLPSVVNRTHRERSCMRSAHTRQDVTSI